MARHDEKLARWWMRLVCARPAVTLGAAALLAAAAVGDAAAGYPRLEVGLAGVEVVKADDARIGMRDSLIASLAPVAFGFTLTFAILWIIGLSINPANIMVLPLMFGIGVDAGVHVVHRYRRDPQASPAGMTGGTGKTITLTSLTAMCGFGALMLARHRGISGLGFVMTAGLGFTLMACWWVLPSWLGLRRRARRPVRIGAARGRRDHEPGLSAT